MFDREKLAADAASFGDRGRAASAARYIAWSEAHPYKPCTHCFGAGSYAETLDGATRRAFDHRDFKPAKECYVGTCPVCRGLGRVPTTREEACRAVRRERLEQRRVYLAARSAVCRERGIGEEAFDRLVKRRLRGETPAAWVGAAQSVAREFGVVT